MAEKTDEQYVDTVRTALAHLKLRVKEARDTGLVVRISAETYTNYFDVDKATVTAHRNY